MLIFSFELTDRSNSLSRSLVYQHRFIAGEDAQSPSNNHLPHFNKAMKKFNVRGTLTDR